MGLRAPGGRELGNILNIYVNTKTNTTSGAVSRVPEQRGSIGEEEDRDKSSS